ncbi:hypothetical protein VOLCADRAFT_106577 [Volvox carteri f. nagariensis]|uniref:Uncharacterized protein n=1 Tax=Volvox carteri f. nagariensis TaxID=3068 RepID=D8U8A7_VOLCA|nr:uncharacterized protein VOLCADRAFT_106577 [Volvox carteri f. nagariensis]EFJ44107.1 hypothetical protein VOLCADRAFT_106577 [Volvox carteri f. nagariensis]|eukprot:XP_002954908.1 hypothetical protein VOLCADRAFT_106577 [Volvox carteri f. nagariensis]
MDLLLCIVEANAAAKALARVAAQSLHAVEDCSSVVECCIKVLPAALSALEGAASTDENLAGQAVEYVQGFIAAMAQLQTAIEGLNRHDGEGVLGILLEHPAAWLETYRAFRSLTVQLVGISTFMRSTAQRGRADDSDEALQSSIRALLGTSNRAREAANLLGSDLPNFARDAAAAGWSGARVQHIPTGGSGAASPCRRCGCGPGGCGPCICGTAMFMFAAANAALQQQEQQQEQRMSLLRRLGKAAACSTPDVRRGCSGSGQSCAGQDGGSGSGLEDAAWSLVARVQDMILFDSEIDQLEQDRAYLQQRVTQLQAVCSCSSVAATAAAGAAAATASEQSTAGSLIQSVVLLAAVDLRLRALGERSSGSGEACGQQLRTASTAANLLSGRKTGRGNGEANLAAAAGRLVDPEDLYDEVRKRRTALRWLPVCFVGA